MRISKVATHIHKECFQAPSRNVLLFPFVRKFENFAGSFTYSKCVRDVVTSHYTTAYITINDKLKNIKKIH